MSNAINPAATHHLPGFITAPGETDFLMTGSVVFLIVLFLFLGSMYFWLHSIPERISHGTGKVQFQMVAVMSLLALFTHNNAFWVGALLLALVPIPDFWTPLATMADSLAKMAGIRPRRTGDEQHTTAHHDAAAATPSPPEAVSAVRKDADIVLAQMDAGVPSAAVHDGIPPASDPGVAARPAARSDNLKPTLSTEGA